jgi:hypothetical protein
MSTKYNGVQVFTSSDVNEVIPDIEKGLIRWVGTGMTAGQQVMLKDAAGHKIWESVALSTQVNDTFPLRVLPKMNLTLTQMDGGTLYIYYALYI